MLAKSGLVIKRQVKIKNKKCKGAGRVSNAVLHVGGIWKLCYENNQVRVAKAPCTKLSL